MRRLTFIKSLIFFGAAAILPQIPKSYDKGKLTHIGDISFENNIWVLKGVWGVNGAKEGARFGPNCSLIHFGGYSPEELLQISIQSKQS